MDHRETSNQEKHKNNVLTQDNTHLLHDKYTQTTKQTKYCCT